MAENKINEAQLDSQLAELEQARPWSPRVMSKFETFIRSAADFDLFRVNPIQFAAERAIAEAKALDLFLHAAKVGIFEMDWHVVCPHCGYVVDSLHGMNQLRNHYRCPTCGADDDYALDDYIQVAFSISPRLREIQYHHPESLSVEDFYFNYRLSKDVLPPLPEVPSWRDLIVHITKDVRYVEPGEKITAELELAPGDLRITDGRACLQLTATQERREQPGSIPIRLVDGKFHSDDPQMRPRDTTRYTAANQPVAFGFELMRELPSGRWSVELENRQERRSALWTFEPGQLPVPVLALRPGVSAKKLLTTQTFQDLFRSEVIKADEALAIKDITFMFTDLKGSTAMYERIGDAKACFLVHQHFDALRQAIRARNGAIVKTIGDAVMAVFDNPADAASAALEMIDALNRFNRTISQELMIKVGIHRGYSMAVTVNEQVDYFGQNVNIAARVQALADANEIYLTADVYDAPGVKGLLAAHEVSPAEALVKGISEKLAVYKVAVRGQA